MHHRGVTHLLLAMLLATLLACRAGEVHAREVQSLQARHQRATPALRQAVAVRLAAVQRAAEAGNLDAAERELAMLEADHAGMRALNSYELANVYNFRAHIHYTKKEFQAALHAWEQVLAQPDLPQAMVQGTRYSLAQLYVATGAWEQAASMLDAWFRSAENPDADAWMLLAQAHYRLGRHDDALQDIERALAAARLRSQPPRESWYLLQRQASFARGDLQATARVLEVLAARWPRKDYFVQLAAVLGEIGDTARERAVLEVAYRAGWLDAERELLDLAYLHLGGETPILAARVLEEGMRAGRIGTDARTLGLLGAALREAHESRRAVEVLGRAAELANDVQAWVRLASAQLEANDDGAAVVAARRALALGGGERPDTVRIMLGMALYDLGNYTEARSAFTEAARDRRSRQSARQWLRFLDAETARARQLAGD